MRTAYAGAADTNTAADQHADTDQYADTDADQYAHTDAHQHAHADAYQYAQAAADQHAHAAADQHAQTGVDQHAHAGAYLYAGPHKHPRPTPTSAPRPAPTNTPVPASAPRPTAAGPPADCVVKHAATPAQLCGSGDGIQYYFVGPGGVQTGPYLSSISELAASHSLAPAAVELYRGTNPMTGKPVRIDYLPNEKLIRVSTFYVDTPYSMDKAYIFTVNASYQVTYQAW